MAQALAQSVTLDVASIEEDAKQLRQLWGKAAPLIEQLTATMHADTVDQDLLEQVLGVLGDMDDHTPQIGSGYDSAKGSIGRIHRLLKALQSRGRD